MLEKPKGWAHCDKCKELSFVCFAMQKPWRGPGHNAQNHTCQLLLWAISWPHGRHDLQWCATVANHEVKSDIGFDHMHNHGPADDLRSNVAIGVRRTWRAVAWAQPLIWLMKRFEFCMQVYTVYLSLFDRLYHDMQKRFLFSPCSSTSEKKLVCCFFCVRQCSGVLPSESKCFPRHRWVAG